MRRDAARRLAGLVEGTLGPGGSWLLDGLLEAEIHTGRGPVLRVSQQYPPGSPARPPTAAQLQAKLADCVSGLDTDPAAWTWQNAADTLRRFLPAPAVKGDGEAGGVTRSARAAAGRPAKGR